MNKRISKKSLKREKTIESIVNKTLDTVFKSLLNDVSYRINTLLEQQNGLGIGAHNLNLPIHMLDGFIFTDNSPSAGYVAWSDCHVVYKGAKVDITDGNSNKKYIWWDMSASPNTVFQVSDTQPTLTDDDVLIVINNGGTHQLNIGEGKLKSGLAVTNGSITGAQVANGAINTSQLASGAVTSTILGSGAVTSAAISSGAVTSGALASGAVTNGKIAANAITGSELATGSVANGKLAAGAVDATALASGAVTSGKLATDAVTSSAIAAGAVGSTELASGAVQTGNIATGAVTSSQIGAGAVASDKLSIAQHLLF